MSTINVDDVQYLPSDETIQVSEPNNDIVTHQQPSSSIQINTQLIENPSLYSTKLPSFDQNNEIMPVAVVYDPKSSQQSFSGNIHDVHEYTIWSIFNLLFCCIIIGGFALYMSCKTRKKKRHGHLLRAQTYSKLAGLLNVIATTSGILIFTLVALRFIGYIDM